MKSTRYLVAVPAALALALAGCGGSTGTSGAGGDTGSDTGSGDTAGYSTDDSNCADEEVFCIGLVTDTGNVDDKSFNQSAHEGAEAAATELEGVYKYIETQDAKDYAANMAQFTDNSYDAIVTVGFLMTEATVAAAEENPETKFIGVDQGYPEGTELTNLTGLIFPEDQAGYAAGFLAGLMTETDKLGQVLGQEIPPVQKFAKGFENGAKAANDAVSVQTVYHPAGDNAFNDPVWGAGEARKQLAQDVDVVFGAGGNTGNGALQEVAKADGAGESVYCIGVDTDQWDTVPQAQPCLITSAMKLITKGVTDTLMTAESGEFEGVQTVGEAGIAPYHDFEDTIPDDVKSQVEEIVAQLQDGSLETGVTL
ncbi:BMP family ABC transporter substrate-binding protein [Phycicoccus sp. BSK3Z-2]|uniref:BMP family ABC transporter substrate-binding protein n=1 Tax=Phycicoccus avicenniae TaxID=2828860 RepID=A0A941HZ88_9MICO|nr:BMP family ABC transporter substrate-binding protein [Phycicoccus avicenniae]MBR7742702.1 BMP family ABC transporter substrate-binding protein [Phycicoccus avicenniae]